MQRYTRYIARQLAHSTLLTALSLTSIVWLMQALRLMDFMVNQGVGVDLFVLLTLLLMPSLLMFILPIALFCAILFTYYKLQQDSELVVLESVGLSLWRQARPALIVASAVVIAGYIVSLYLMPLCYGRFRELQSFLRNNYVSVLLQEGVFNSPVDGLTVYVREREGSGKFRGILVHDNRTPGMVVTMMAGEGKLMSTPSGQRFLLTNGNRQEMSKGRLSLLNFDSYTLDMSFYSNARTDRKRDPRELSFGELLQTENLSDAEIDKRRGEAHQRILWPGLSFTLALVALAYLLSGEFNRRGHVRRLVAAVMTVSAITILAIVFRNLIAGSVLFAFLAYANVVIPALIASRIISRHSVHGKKKKSFRSQNEITATGGA